MSRAATAQASFSQVEEEMRRLWRRVGAPGADPCESISTGAPGSEADTPFVICQQPLNPVAQSWFDQARLLVTADLLARFRRMQGRVVRRQAGWVCHGLPIEVAVERTLGSDLRALDLVGFNAACREAAVQGVESGERLAERLGVWPEPASSYATLTPQATDTLWAAVRRLWDAGVLRHDRLVVPVCPRCATPLSSAEAMRCQVEATTQSIWMRLPLAGSPDRSWSDSTDTYLVTSTPAPWMLVGMVALVAHPKVPYAVVDCAEADEPPCRLLLAESALEQLLPTATKGQLPAGYRVLRTLRGKSLRGVHYRPPFTFLPAGEGTGRVVLSPEVPRDQGTGLLPVVPAFDQFSLSLALAHHLPVPELLDDWGNLGPAIAGWQGLSPLEAERFLVEDLLSRGLLVRQETGTRRQSLCPHCQTPLLPQVREVWQALAEQGPWTIGRDRAWGVPMPVWSCDGCGAQLCLADLDELAQRTGLDREQIDPHRPMMDRLALPCEQCGGLMRRTGAVLDGDVEAAVVPLCTAPQPGPGAEHGSYPFDLVVSLDDPHTGWLAALAEAASLLRRSPAWTHSLVLPAGDGSPLLRTGAEGGWDGIRSMPASAIRWAAFTGSSPAHAEETFLRPLWKLVTGEPSAADAPPAALRFHSGPELSASGRQIIDRWLLARLHQVIGQVTQALETGHPEPAAQQLSDLLGDLLQLPALGYDLTSASQIPAGAGLVLETVGYLLAPFTPHLAEAILQRVARSRVVPAHGLRGSSSGPYIEGPHPAQWPTANPAWADAGLLAQMSQVKELASLGADVRAQAGIGPERLLRLALLGRLVGPGTNSAMDGTEGWAYLLPPGELLQKKLGVHSVEFVSPNLAPVRWRLTANRGQPVEHALGYEEIDAALAELAPDATAELAARILGGASVALQTADRAVELRPDQICATPLPAAGWAAATGSGWVVLLEVEPSPKDLASQLGTCEQPNAG